MENVIRCKSLPATVARDCWLWYHNDWFLAKMKSSSGWKPSFAAGHWLQLLHNIAEFDTKMIDFGPKWKVAADGNRHSLQVIRCNFWPTVIRCRSFAAGHSPQKGFKQYPGSKTSVDAKLGSGIWTVLFLSRVLECNMSTWKVTRFSTLKPHIENVLGSPLKF